MVVLYKRTTISPPVKVDVMIFARHYVVAGMSVYLFPWYSDGLNG